MKQALITLAFVVGALGLTIAAVSVEPEARRPSIFSDQGEELFPAFRDVLAVKALEIVDYNEAGAVASPLKVEFRKGKWILPSHYDYPAEARDRLAKTAGALLDLKKDIVASDRVEDHARYGVIDPLDTKVASLTGRGKHVTLRDGSGAVLVDVILGEPVKERPGYRYVRLPDEKRVFAVKTDADPSARFEDWADGSILRVSPAQIRSVNILNYSVNESTGQLVNPQRIALRRSGDQWAFEGGGTPNAPTVQALLNTLANLRISGVRPKPPELARQLREKAALEMSLEVVLSLRQRGYFLTPDGRLLANEGETQVESGNGVAYTLRFGEIAGAEGEAKPEIKDPAKAAEEKRFLFVTASYDAARAARYGTTGGNGEAVANAARARFADWYYVISGAEFTRLRPRREMLDSNK
ncbi:MAG: DUF4340 domain-containing protein [Bryobacterales bacterium]|nr:DUF4340 domain-containing protein [Bryobacterales bacterium]